MAGATSSLAMVASAQRPVDPCGEEGADGWVPPIGKGREKGKKGWLLGCGGGLVALGRHGLVRGSGKKGRREEVSGLGLRWPKAGRRKGGRGGLLLGLERGGEGNEPVGHFYL